MYQILQHALSDPSNTTKFTLLFGNVEERDILLKNEFDQLKKKHPDTFEVVHVLGTAPEGWKGTFYRIPPRLSMGLPGLVTP
jgi:cytochrome-b5 reductase